MLPKQYNVEYGLFTFVMVWLTVGYDLLPTTQDSMVPHSASPNPEKGSMYMDFASFKVEIS